MRHATRVSTRLSMRWVIALAAALATASLGCRIDGLHSAAAGGQSPDRVYQDLVNALAAESMEGRGVGTEGLVKARELVIGEFRDGGLAPAVGGEFTQAFAIAGEHRSTGQSLSLGNSETHSSRAMEAGRDFTIADGSAHGAFNGPAVFVGFGIVNPGWGYNSYAGLPSDALVGKVAIAMRFEPSDDEGHSAWAEGQGPSPWSPAAGADFKAMWAANRGAAALLLIDPPYLAAGTLPPPTRTIGGRNTSIPVLQISQATFRRIVTAAGYDAAQQINAWWRAANDGSMRPETLGPMTLHGYVNPSERVDIDVHNVVGRVAGAGDLADEVVVVGAHYDHIGFGGMYSRSGPKVVHPGADDNASGTAGLVMMARRFAAAAKGGRLPDNRRTVLFAAFSAEERGLLGSTHMVEHWEQLGLRGEQVVAMLNMDMIGRLADDAIMVWGVGSGSRWPAILDEVAPRSDLRVIRKGSSIAGSDHLSFHIAKIPALQFSTGFGELTHLHTPDDTPDQIDAPGAVRVLDLVADVLTHLLTDSQAAGSHRAGGRRQPKRTPRE